MKIKIAIFVLMMFVNIGVFASTFNAKVFLKNYQDNPVNNIRCMISIVVTMGLNETVMQEYYCEKTTDNEGALNFLEELKYNPQKPVTLNIKITTDDFYAENIKISYLKNEWYFVSKLDYIADKFDMGTIKLANKKYGFYKNSFINNENHKELKENIDNHLNNITKSGLGKDCLLNYECINIEEFKKMKNLRIEFENLNIYNNTKLNQYDVAKIIFDSTIKKLLDEFKEIIQQDTIDGLDITIKSYNRDFVNKGEIKSSNIRYIMKKSDIISYKEKDITGQDFVDKSYILIDDERVSLKFQ